MVGSSHYTQSVRMTSTAASDDGLDWAAHLETREGVWAARAARHRLAKTFCICLNGYQYPAPRHFWATKLLGCRC